MFVGGSQRSDREHRPLTLRSLEQDRLTSKKTRAEYIAEATGFVNAASRAGGGIGGSTEILGYLTRGTLAFASRQGNETMQAFDGVLTKSPHNIVALLGKVGGRDPGPNV